MLQKIRNIQFVLFSQLERTVAMIAKLSPTAEKKLARRLTSSVLKFFARAQESVFAKVTSSQPEGPLQEFIESPILEYARKGNFVKKFLIKK